MKMIRWPGLIAFVVIFGGLFVFFYFFATSMVKDAIEDYGSQAVGAQVNVDSVDMTLDPLGFRIGRVQVTNPDAPMTNAAEIKGMAFELGFWNLFMGQVIVNEMGVNELRFNTPREVSGELPDWKKKKPKEEDKGPSVLDTAVQKLPSSSEILAKETLMTDVLSEELNANYEKRMAELDKMKADLPNEKKLKAYEKEIKELTSGKLESLEDFKQRKERLSQINKELKQEKEKISEAKSAYRTTYKELKSGLEELKDAPSQDWKNLKKKYSLDAGGATNLTRLLFGNEAAGWTQTTLDWYEKARPYLESAEEKETEEEAKVERQTGRYIHFGGVEALPEFLLRQANIDIVLPAGHLDGKLKDVTHQPEVLGRPALLTVSGTELDGYDSINLKAEFNHVNPKNSYDKAVFTVKKMEISNFKVSSDSSFKLKLVQAKADIKGRALVKKGKLDLDIDTSFTDAQFKSDADSGTARTVGELLESIHQFTITIMADGDLDDIDTSFDSSLDEQMKAAMNEKIDAKQAELEAELKAKLQTKLTEKTGKYSQDLEGLLKGEKSLDEQQKELEKMAEAKLTTWEEQQKAELEKKKQKEKAKAKKKAEEEVKDKLKGLGF